MAVDMFLKLEPIKGESQDDKHKDEIDILNWTWGMSQSGTTHTGTGSGGGKVSVQDLTFTHWVDKASADLYQCCCTGKHIQEGTLVCRKAGGKPLDYIIIKMNDILVTHVSTGGSHGEDRLTENVTLNFAKFKLEYVQQLANGAAGAKPFFGYDIQKSKPA